MDHFLVIKRPLVTEKAVQQQGEKNCYGFEVHLKATKEDVKKAVEKVFSVNVTGVNTSIIRGKQKRVGRYATQKTRWKKAFVTLKQGQKIEVIEGI